MSTHTANGDQRHGDVDDITDDISAVLSAWATAEVDGDADTLSRLIAPDFTGIGPLGFTLTRQDWLDRHTGGLSYDAFELQEVRLRVYGDAAVAIARQNSRGSYRSRPVPGALRVTIVLTRTDQRWQLAVVHMSFIAGTTGAPPIPGRG